MTERAEAIKEFHEKWEKYNTLSDEIQKLRKEINGKQEEIEAMENQVNALQNTGHIVGEVMRLLGNQKCAVKTCNGPRYVVGWRSTIKREDLIPGRRVALETMTLTIMKLLGREIDPMVYQMESEKPTGKGFREVGGLSKQIRDIREVIELPLKHPELFKRLGISPPKGILLYGPPGTGKTMLARAAAETLDVTFLKIAGSSIIDKYIGESARVVREMFTYARDHEPCIIFIDEIDSIGSKRGNDGSSADREIQRTLIELLTQIDGFDALGRVKIIMATNRPDTLDPALLRPGRLDRKIEIPLPNDHGRLDILRIHSSELSTNNNLNLEEIAKLTDGFNGADLRNICTEAGLFAIRGDREHVTQEDMMKAARKISETKKLETNLEYEKI